MPIFLILVLIVFLTILVGFAVSVGVSRLDTAIKDNQAALADAGNLYNLNATMGHEIAVAADFESQMKEARRLAAKHAASLPRGANMGIGSLGNSTLRTAGKNLANDPMSTVRIAKHHGWDGARTGLAAAGQAAAAAAPAAAAAAGGKVELVAGKDYPVIEITDDMPDAEKRKARIANAKAKSAAMKAAKAAGASAAAPAAAVASTVPQPKLVEITDDMSPDEKRKATIANAKAQSAYKKALKAAGEAAPAAAPAVSAASAAPAVPEPELIEITDSMSPDEVRKARISNAKAKSAYNKALKAAGASAPAAAPAAPAAPAPIAAPEPVANMPAPPELVEITDGMDPDDVRKARIANAKAKSAYNKALKAAGIDPKSL